MNCGYSKEILALYIEDDLPSQEAVNNVEAHLLACAACRQYCAELRKSQSFIKSRFEWSHQPPVSQEMLAGMRRGVMSQVEAAQESLGWLVRLERFFMIGLRRPLYAVAGLGIITIVSVSLLAEMRQPLARPNQTAAVFAGKDTLMCPSTYREWVFLGCSLGRPDTPKHSSEAYHNVYINPDAYSEYRRSGRLPDGTVMVLEMFSGENKNVMSLAVSVKDSRRFDQGWGFYNFAGNGGGLQSEADPLTQSAGCLACHGGDKPATKL